MFFIKGHLQNIFLKSEFFFKVFFLFFISIVKIMFDIYYYIKNILRLEKSNKKQANYELATNTPKIHFAIFCSLKKTTLNTLLCFVFSYWKNIRSAYWSWTETQHFDLSLQTRRGGKESHYKLCFLCVSSEWFTLQYSSSIHEHNYRLILMLFTLSTLFIWVTGNNTGKSRPCCVHFANV